MYNIFCKTSELGFKILMKDASEKFAEIAFLLAERQKKEAEVRAIDQRIFSLLGVDVFERKRKTLIPVAMRAACGLR